MKRKTLIASILMALGIMTLVYQGIRYKIQQEALDLGPLQVATQRAQTLPIPYIAGAIALLSGLALLFIRASKTPVPVFEREN